MNALMQRRSFLTLLGGAAAAWPMAARAQRAKRLGIMVGYLESDPDGQARIETFLKSLASLGWKEGNNIHIDYRWGSIQAREAQAHAAELIALAPDVIYVQSAPGVTALREQTRAIPIVFIQTGDPVGVGTVKSIARPGGNFTGFLTYEPTVSGKCLQLLKDVAPHVTRVKVMQFSNSAWRDDFSAIKAVAKHFGVEVSSAIFNDVSEIEPTLMTFARDPNGGLIFPPDTRTTGYRNLIVELAAKYQLPAIYTNSIFTKAGGLISYGVDQLDIARRSVIYVDRILKGEDPSTLPVQAPTKFELVINLIAARALNLSVSPTMQIGADEVIE